MDEGVILWNFFKTCEMARRGGFDVERDLTEKAWTQT